MTAYDPTNDTTDVSAHGDRTRGPAPSGAPSGDADRAASPEVGAGSGPQLDEPFWREHTGHVEAPLYRADEPIIEPAAEHDPWSTGPVSSTEPVSSPGRSPRPDRSRLRTRRRRPHGAVPPGPARRRRCRSLPTPTPTAAGRTLVRLGGPLLWIGESFHAPAGSPDNATKPRRMRSAIIGTAVAAALIGGAAGAGTVALEGRSSSTTASSVLSSTGSTATTSAVTNGTVSAAAAKITPSVVTIQVVGSNESGTGSGRDRAK